MNESTTNRLVTIYALCDPDTQEVRYIGRAFNANERYFFHLQEIPEACVQNPKHKWLIQLITSGSLPCLRTLEVTDEANMKLVEKKWINHGVSLGWQLLNVHGVPGVRRAYDRSLQFQRMNMPKMSFDLDSETLTKLDELSEHLNAPPFVVIAIAIRLLHQQEIKIMNSQTDTLTIGKITTKPEHDPYVNIEGVVSRTYLKLDPRDRTVWVTQEYQDNSTPSDEWHGLILTWVVPGNPIEADMREWIDQHLDDLAAICNGYESHWNGNNHVGRLTDEARSLKESIEFELDNGDGLFRHYEYWTMDDWTDPMLGDIAADTTDEQLRAMAQDAITALDSHQILDSDEDDVYKYFVSRRDERKDE